MANVFLSHKETFPLCNHSPVVSSTMLRTWYLNSVFEWYPTGWFWMGFPRARVHKPFLLRVITTSRQLCTVSCEQNMPCAFLTWYAVCQCVAPLTDRFFMAMKYKFLSACGRSDDTVLCKCDRLVSAEWSRLAEHGPQTTRCTFVRTRDGKKVTHFANFAQVAGKR